MNWLILIIAGLFETSFAFCLGKAQQTSVENLYWWLVLQCAFLSMFLMYKAISGENGLPIGTAYAIWTGIGAVGSVLMGFFSLTNQLLFGVSFLCQH
jgi:quaternary ammonium compound-resistance protein SugE